MSVIFTKAPLRIAPWRRWHRPSLVLPRARGFPRRRRDRQVRLHAHAHRLPAALSDEVLELRGGRRSERDPASDPARGDPPPLERSPLEIASVADVPAGTGMGSSGSFTVCLLKALGARAARGDDPADAWRRTPARSRSTYSTSRSASRTSTWRRMAASAHTRSTLTAPWSSSRSSSRRRRSIGCETTSCSSTRARPARHRRILADQVERTRARRRVDAENLHRTKQIGLESRDLLEAGDLEQLRRADARALGEQARALPRHGDESESTSSTRWRGAAA